MSRNPAADVVEEVGAGPAYRLALPPSLPDALVTSLDLSASLDALRKRLPAEAYVGSTRLSAAVRRDLIGASELALRDGADDALLASLRDVSGALATPPDDEDERSFTRMDAWARLAGVAAGADSRDAAVDQARELLDREVRARCAEGRTGDAQRWVEAGLDLATVLGTRLREAAMAAAAVVDLRNAGRAEVDRLERYFPRVGWMERLSAFLRPDSPIWALHLYGPGGVGKSELVHHFAWGRRLYEGRDAFRLSPAAIERLGWVASAPAFTVTSVDFDYLDPRYPERAPGLFLAQLAEGLALTLPELASAFTTFVQARRAAESGPGGGVWLDGVGRGVLDAFCGVLRACPGGVLLVVDTCEEVERVGSQGMGEGGLDVMLQTLQLVAERLGAEVGTRLRVLLAGRRLLADSGAGWTARRPSGRQGRPWLGTAELLGFSDQESSGFLAANGVAEVAIPTLLAAARQATPAPAVDPVPATRPPLHVLPFDLLLYAGLWREGAMDPATVLGGALSPRQRYIELRIAGRLDPAWLPVLVLLGICGWVDGPLYALTAATFPLAEVLRHDWLDRDSARPNELARVAQTLAADLREWALRRDPEGATRLAGKVVASLAERRPLTVEGIETIVVLARQVPAEARRAWDSVQEQLLATLASGESPPPVLGRTLSRVAAAVVPKPGRPPHPLAADVLALDLGVAMLAGELATDELSRRWVQVGELAETSSLRVRAEAGLVFAVPGELPGLLALPSQGLDLLAAAAVAGALERLLDVWEENNLEVPAPFEPDARALLAWMEGLPELGGAFGDVRIRILGCLGEPIAEAWAARSCVPVPPTPGWPGSEAVDRRTLQTWIHVGGRVGLELAMVSDLGRVEGMRLAIEMMAAGGPASAPNTKPTESDAPWAPAALVRTLPPAIGLFQSANAVYPHNDAIVRQFQSFLDMLRTGVPDRWFDGERARLQTLAARWERRPLYASEEGDRTDVRPRSWRLADLPVSEAEERWTTLALTTQVDALLSLPDASQPGPDPASWFHSRWRAFGPGQSRAEAPLFDAAAALFDTSPGDHAIGLQLRLDLMELLLCAGVATTALASLPDDVATWCKLHPHLPRAALRLHARVSAIFDIPLDASLIAAAGTGASEVLFEEGELLGLRLPAAAGRLCLEAARAAGHPFVRGSARILAALHGALDEDPNTGAGLDWISVEAASGWGVRLRLARARVEGGALEPTPDEPARSAELAHLGRPSGPWLDPRPSAALTALLTTFGRPELSFATPDTSPAAWTGRAVVEIRSAQPVEVTGLTGTAVVLVDGLERGRVPMGPEGVGELPALPPAPTLLVDADSAYFAWEAALPGAVRVPMEAPQPVRPDPSRTRVQVFHVDPSPFMGRARAWHAAGGVQYLMKLPGEIGAAGVVVLYGDLEPTGEGLRLGAATGVSQEGGGFRVRELRSMMKSPPNAIWLAPTDEVRPEDRLRQDAWRRRFAHELSSLGVGWVVAVGGGVEPPELAGAVSAYAAGGRPLALGVGGVVYGRVGPVAG